MRFIDYAGERRSWLFLLPVLLAAAWLFAHGMRGYPLLPFDEARLAVSAAEMRLNGQWLIPYYGGTPDLFSVKPPLMIWLQSASIGIFGTSVGAIRLPAVLAAFATLALLYGFAITTLRNWRAGVLACAVLVTTGGYVQAHVARTGDYDAPLILFQTAQLIFFFRFAEWRKGRDWWVFVLALILAAFTKGVVGFAPLPAIALHALGTGMAKPLLTSRRFYGGVFAMLATIGGYYFYREFATPGYLASLWSSEIADRVTVPINGQGGSWTFYLSQMAHQDCAPWLFILPAALALAFFKGSAQERRATLLLGLFAAIWLAVVSAAGTKMFWYEAPVYPALAMVSGIGLARGWALPFSHFRSPGRFGLRWAEWTTNVTLANFTGPTLPGSTALPARPTATAQLLSWSQGSR
ncbi:MAG TPA: glycosyltransferase family 39 protein [Allosphingosinicella sp.]|jgi:4-amino-4-deoxy-L-arabinose transferase-like glycosyltransferase